MPNLVNMASPNCNFFPTLNEQFFRDFPSMRFISSIGQLILKAQLLASNGRVGIPILSNFVNQSPSLPVTGQLAPPIQ